VLLVQGREGEAVKAVQAKRRADVAGRHHELRGGGRLDAHAELPVAQRLHEPVAHASEGSVPKEGAHRPGSVSGHRRNLCVGLGLGHRRLLGVHAFGLGLDAQRVEGVESRHASGRV
jgi:hypothetical protein